MPKVIFFDLWNTLAQFIGIEEYQENMKRVLGEHKYQVVMEHFIAWHLITTDSTTYIEQLNEKIQLNQQELRIINDFIHYDAIEKYPETDAVLEQIQKIGIPLVLITNSPPTTKAQFASLGLAPFFDKTVFSFEVGMMKPSKEIFHYALEGFGILPQEGLMIGDSLEKDVHGATSVGLNAILLDRTGFSDYPRRITTLAELLDNMSG